LKYQKNFTTIKNEITNEMIYDIKLNLLISSAYLALLERDKIFPNSESEIGNQNIIYVFKSFLIL
jgi:hypothetical protein